MHLNISLLGFSRETESIENIKLGMFTESGARESISVDCLQEDRWKIQDAATVQDGRPGNSLEGGLCESVLEG